MQAAIQMPTFFHLRIFFILIKIAVLSDIEKAFYQISVDENDRGVFRFLFIDVNRASNHAFKVII